MRISDWSSDVCSSDLRMSKSKLQSLMARGTDFLGCEVAILCGAMSWVSERHLVAAISNAGGFGVIACGAMTPDLLDTEIAATKALTSRPFGEIGRAHVELQSPMRLSHAVICLKTNPT